MKKPSKPKPKRKRGSNGSPEIRLPAERPSFSRKPVAPERPVAAATASWRRAGARLAAIYSADERQDLALLLLPFFLVAFAVATTQALRPAVRYGDLIATAPGGQDRRDVARERQAMLERWPGIAALPTLVPLREARVPPPTVLRSTADVIPALTAVTYSGAATDQPRRPASVLAPVVVRLPEVEAYPWTPPLIGSLPPLPEIAALDADPLPPGAGADVCVAAPRPLSASVLQPAVSTFDGADFGVRLAQAARAQTGDFVVYSDRYRRISYPMGDISPLFGVCTDLVIRAYRALGIDLQTLVYQQRSGSGDTNIDHRRTEILRRFFATNGEKLQITEFHEDYRPGDIVTYYRPQNRRSRSHIAIVADVVGPSGRPMIVHNRGWGPQMEDALFVDLITGHYRFSGLKQNRPEVVLAGARRSHR